MPKTSDALSRRHLRCGLAAGVASAALLAGLLQAHAQDAVTLEEISVEGQQPTFGTKGVVATRSTAGMKSNASIAETPATVSVITREELDIRGVQSLETATAYTPGIISTDYAGGQGAPAFTLRGFRTLNFENVYEDGLRYGFNAYDQNVEPYAYERIDVIKGPVSVLYGAGQPGGIINLISKRPQFTRFNEIYIQGGSYNRIQGAFDLTGPFEGNEQFAYRFTGLVRQADTQVPFSPDDRVFLAPAITWRPDSDTSLTVLAKYAHYGRGGSEQVLPIIGSIVPSPTLGFFKRDLFIGQPNFNAELIDNRSIGYILDHSFAPGWIFHSAFRYLETDSDFKLTGFGGYNPAISEQFILTYPYKRDQTQHALLADNHVEGKFDTGFIQHNVVGGVDFQNSVRRNHQFLGPNRLFDLFDPVYTYTIDYSTFTDYLHLRQFGQQIGAYVQDQMRIGGFILTGSVRNDWYQGSVLTDSNYIPPFTLNRDEQKFTALSYRGALGYEFDNGMVPYVAYSTSFNPQLAGLRFNASGEASALAPNEGKQIEGGLKYQPPGINAIFTASGFQITQTNVPFPDPLHPGFFIQTGEAQATGFELEGKATLANGLTLIAGFAHLDARVTKDDSINFITGRSLEGNRLPNVPRNAFSLFVDYAFPWGDEFSGLRAGAGVRYIGARTDSTNLDYIPAYALVDASVSYDLSRLDPAWKGFTISANAINLFDKRYFTSAFYQGTVFEGFRRTVYGQLTYRW